MVNIALSAHYFSVNNGIPHRYNKYIMHKNAVTPFSITFCNAETKTVHESPY